MALEPERKLPAAPRERDDESRRSPRPEFDRRLDSERSPVVDRLLDPDRSPLLDRTLEPERKERLDDPERKLER